MQQAAADRVLFLNEPNQQVRTVDLRFPEYVASPQSGRCKSDKLTSWPQNCKCRLAIQRACWSRKCQPGRTDCKVREGSERGKREEAGAIEEQLGACRAAGGTIQKRGSSIGHDSS